MRAILDSKYNEITLLDDPKLISRFPEFVYSWLNNFSYSHSQFQIVNSADLDETFIT